MNWYYVENGQQTGPVAESDLEGLARSGKIQPDTLVWREGMTNWQPFGEVRPADIYATAAAPAAAGMPATAAAAAAANEGGCAECGGIFPLQDMIPYGNMRVCANCKPILVQRLAEGARLKTGEINYAGFWTRFSAVFLDGILLWIVNTSFSLALGMGFLQGAGRQPAAFGARYMLLVLFQLAIGLSYEVILVGKYGATLGKMACKIRVVTADGGRVSYLRALGRYFAKMLSAFACMIGYLMAGFDDEKRALHDRICNTRVVVK